MPELKILKTTVDIGLGHEVKFLHLTDTHIALDDEGDERCVADFLSGMTDRYAIETYNQLYVPRVWRGIGISN